MANKYLLVEYEGLEEDGQVYVPLKETLELLLASKSNVDHGHSDATIDTAGFMSAKDKTKLESLKNYVLGAATEDTLGGIKVADASLSGLLLDSDGSLSLSVEKAKTLIGEASSSASGLMSNADKNKLDDLENTYISKSMIGVKNGVAKLDENGTVPAAQLPSYVDDVLEYDTFEKLPSEGVSGIIYVTKDNNLTYRWSGENYVEISKSLALGITPSTAFAGDKGNEAYLHAQSKGVKATEGLYKIETNDQGHVVKATEAILSDFTSLGLATPLRWGKIAVT